MKKRIISYIALLLLTTSCSLELVENTKSLLSSCSEATGVAASAQSATPLNVAMSLTGSTSDISRVVWQITKSGTEYYNSTTTTSPFSLTSSTLSTDGTFTITATVTTQCGKSYSLSGSYTYTNKTCTKATGVTASAQTSTPLNVALSLTGSISDIASVIWVVSQNTTEYYRSGSQTSTPFSLTTPTLTTDGTFTVTAQIVDKCGASYTLTTSYTYIVSNSLIIPMIYVEGGTFQMGSTTGFPDEQPVHSVALSNYAISKYEITVNNFKAFIDDTSYQTDADKTGGSYVWDGSNWSLKSGVNWRYSAAGILRVIDEYNHPVIHVSWNDAVAYCIWLSTKMGKTCRLPTEAEWEYASRGGKFSKGYTYSGSNIFEDVALSVSNSIYMTHPVGQKVANELGIYDMSGNVWEWCSDWYGTYAASSQTNPTGASSGTRRILRGGRWNSDPQYSRVVHRNHNTPDNRDNGIGFRVASSQ